MAFGETVTGTVIKMIRPDYISAYEWDQLTDAQQRRELQLLAQDDAPQVVVKPDPKPRNPKASKKPAPPQHIKPRTIEDAFVVVNGELMRRRVAIVQVVVNGELMRRQIEGLTPCGDRVRFDDRVLSSRVVAHYLTTGEMLTRAPQEPRAPRYRAQVRDGARVVHLGYFASQADRDAVTFAYKLGIPLLNNYPNGY